MPIAVPGTVASGWAGLTVSCATGSLAARLGPAPVIAAAAPARPTASAAAARRRPRRGRLPGWSSLRRMACSSSSAAAARAGGWDHRPGGDHAGRHRPASW